VYSLISTGTDLMKLAEAKMSTVGKARARPDQARKVLDAVMQHGAVASYKKVMSRLGWPGEAVAGRIQLKLPQGPRWSLHRGQTDSILRGIPRDWDGGPQLQRLSAAHGANPVPP
jgi:hypothetical protein